MDHTKHRVSETIAFVSGVDDDPQDADSLAVAFQHGAGTALVERLNADPACTGYIVQLPLPRHISELRAQSAIDPSKDVDGLHPMNVGLMVRGEPAFPPAGAVVLDLQE